MDIQAIKGNTNILQIAEELGIQIDKNTKRARCPFHEDKTPSLQFSESKQIATCFSSKCTAGTMDVIELVKRKNNWELPQTLNFLQGNTTEPQLEPTTPKISDEERILLLTQLFETFERSFLASKPAKDYAESRKLNHKTLQTGYNTATFHHTINLPKNADKAKELLAKYEQLGIIKQHQSNNYTVFGKGCLVFPLKNEKNQIVSFYFREIDNNKSNKHYYLKNRQGLYPNYPPAETKTIIITECIIDSISLKQSVSNDFTILANYGTEGGKEQTEAIEKLQELQEIIIFFDGDEAGKKGAEKLANQLQKENLVIKIVQTPENEDINSLLQEHDSEVFNHLLDNSIPFSFQLNEIEKPTEQPKTNNLLSFNLKGNLLKSEESLKVTIEVINLETGRKLTDKVE